MKDFIKKILCLHEYEDVDAFSEDYPKLLVKMYWYHPYVAYRCIHCHKIIIKHRNEVVQRPLPAHTYYPHQDR